MSGFDLNDDDVVCTGASSSWNFGLGTTFKPGELFKAAMDWIGKVDNACSYANWFKPSGIQCQILRTDGGGWQSGKVRFRVEFIPDNPPPTKPIDPNSPLDDLRTNLDI